MRLSRTDAQAQGRRLQSNIPSAFPKATLEDTRKEVVNALMRNCVDVTHATRTVTAVLESAPEPKNLIAEIKRCAAATLTPEAPPPGCDVCRRKDPYTGAETFAPHVPGERNGYTVGVRCSCLRGQWFTKRDQERAAAASEELLSAAHHEHPADADLMRIAAGDTE